jgi:hypothetical protein
MIEIGYNCLFIYKLDYRRIFLAILGLEQNHLTWKRFEPELQAGPV